MLERENFQLDYLVPKDIEGRKFKFRTYDFPKNSQFSRPDFTKDSVEVSLEDIHKMNPVYNSTTMNSCVIFWDDIVQFTTLGALDLFKELVIDSYENERNVEESKRFEFEYFHEQFFGRTNDLIDGEKFMYIALNSVYSLTQLERFFRKFYYIILTKSPMSGIVPAIGTSIHMMKKVIFLFKYPMNDIIKEKLKDDLYLYWDCSPSTKEIIFYNLDEVTEEEVYLKHSPSAIFTPKADITLPILVQNKIENVDLFTHIKHNGLSPEFLEQYVLKLKMAIGPGFTKIHFYDDQIHIDDPHFYEKLSDLQEELENEKHVRKV